MIRNRIHRAVTDPEFAQKTAPAEAAIVASAYGVDVALIYTLARAWLFESGMAGSAGLDDIETAHHIEFDHQRGWAGFLADPYVIEADEISEKVRADVLHAAREWLIDASHPESVVARSLPGMSVEQLLWTVDRAYEGGWLRFLDDGNP
ncbi:hypothetical protein ACI2LF_43730 [Kribbella sp. NPDC020789]